MKKISTRSLARCAMIAALYFVLSALLLPLSSFGTLQVRVAEAFTLLPVVTPLGIPGVTLGCALTNAWGVASGADILGPLDILLGSAATLVAALLTRRLRFVRWRGLPVLAVLPPIILNALVVGGELSYMMTGGFSPAVFWLNAAQVGAGELIACVTLGLPLVWALERNQRAILLFEE